MVRKDKVSRTMPYREPSENLPVNNALSCRDQFSAKQDLKYHSYGAYSSSSFPTQMQMHNGMPLDRNTGRAPFSVHDFQNPSRIETL